MCRGLIGVLGGNMGSGPVLGLQARLGAVSSAHMRGLKLVAYGFRPAGVSPGGGEVECLATAAPCSLFLRRTL